MTQHRLAIVLRVLAVAVFLTVSGRCAYLEHRLASLTKRGDVVPSAARKSETPPAAEPRISSGEESSGEVGRDSEEASRSIKPLGPAFSEVLPPGPPVRIRETAPGVFTNRDPDPAELPSR
jgi:hypothetical protein